MLRHFFAIVALKLHAKNQGNLTGVKKKNASDKQTDEQTDGRTDGHGLFHKTLSGKAGGPNIDLFLLSTQRLH